MTLRCAIAGNVAQNAYLIAKGLRALGVEADSYDFGGGYALASPWWEEADFDPMPVLPEYWAWSALPTRTPYRRPPWAKILGNDGAAPWYDTQEAYEADLVHVLRGERLLLPAHQQRREVWAALQESRCPPVRREAMAAHFAGRPAWRALRAVAARYDLLVLCGGLADYGVLLPPDQPWIAFEHGTMRHAIDHYDPTQRALALAYQLADAVVLTNADCWEAAGMLGVRDKASFIPHPLDETRFTPGDCPERPAMCAELGGVERLFFAPARHSRHEASGSKRNDRILHAYARYVREAEPAGAPRAGLILSTWGQPEHVQESADLATHLGLDGRIAWLPCLPKPRLVEFYRAADVVLDQFSDTVGSFGAVTAEALSCGRPVVTYYSEEAHSWCRDVLPEHPPVWTARTSDQIYAALCRLAKDDYIHASLSAEGPLWIKQFHSLERVCQRHKALYERVLRERTGAGRGVLGGLRLEDAAHLVETDCGAVGVRA